MTTCEPVPLSGAPSVRAKNWIFPSFAPASVVAALHRRCLTNTSRAGLVQSAPDAQGADRQELQQPPAAYLGHEDAGSVTAADIVRWHDSLVRPGTVTHETFIKKHVPLSKHSGEP